MKKRPTKARGWLRQGINAVGRRLSPLILRVSDKARRRLNERRSEDLLSCLQSCGSDVRVESPFRFSDPRSVSIGNRVTIEPGSRFATEGGLTIGDGVRIGRNVHVETVRNEACAGKATVRVPSPVAIGRNVCVGAGSSVLAGVRIGEGAVIGPRTVVTHDVPPSPAVRASNRQPSCLDKPHWDDPSVRVFFVVSTGRSGSQTIAKVLSQHPKITCLHEPRPQMIRLSTEFAHGVKAAAAVEDELRAIFCESSVSPIDRLQGESDQKYWNLIPFLAKMIPQSRFIWLIRDGRAVVSSTCERGWFAEKAADLDPAGDLSQRWMSYRLNGAAAGAFGRDEWARLALFERNCWYWTHVNSGIERDLACLPAERWRVVRIEDLTGSMQDLYRFFGAAPSSAIVVRHNSSVRPVRDWSGWDGSEQAAFDRRCGQLMDRRYPRWRDSK